MSAVMDIVMLMWNRIQNNDNWVNLAMVSWEFSFQQILISCSYFTGDHQEKQLWISRRYLLIIKLTSCSGALSWSVDHFVFSILPSRTEGDHHLSISIILPAINIVCDVKVLVLN